MIRVTQTIVATTSDGERLFACEPTEVQWYKGESLMAAASAVNQIMADSEDKKRFRTLSINIDLEWSE